MISWLWSIMFFLTLFVLGIDSIFSSIECLNITVLDVLGNMKITIKRVMVATAKNNKKNGTIGGGRCYRCNQYCYMIMIHCQTCGWRKVSCSRHIIGLCSCDKSQYILYERLSNSQMQTILSEITDHGTTMKAWMLKFDC